MLVPIGSFADVWTVTVSSCIYRLHELGNTDIVPGQVYPSPASKYIVPDTFNRCEVPY